MTVKATMLKIRRLQMTPVQVPMNYALGASRARLASAPLLLIALETEEAIGREMGSFGNRCGSTLPVDLKVWERIDFAIKQFKPHESGGLMQK